MTSESIASLAARFASGKADPVDATMQGLNAAKAAGNAFITLTAERALFEAEQSRDRWRRGLPLSRFDGVPISWKDLFDLKGTVTTAGSATLADSELAAEDAALLRHAARAGLGAVGKTNLSEFAFSGLGLNPHFGTPVGPGGRADRVPGGSSSGAAVATAAGAGLCGIGTDTAGSVRIPAAFHGLVGYRPSMGRYSAQGVFPLARSFDTPGPLARSVADCITIDAVLAGRPDRSLKPARLNRAAFVADERLLAGANVAPAVRRNAERRIAELERRGARIEIASVQSLRAAEEALDTLGWLGAIEGSAFHRERLSDAALRARIDRRVVARLEGAGALPIDRAVRLAALSRELARTVEMELDGALLLFPTVPHVAPLLAEVEVSDEAFVRTNVATLRSTLLASFLLMPGIALPSGVDEDGLPTSLLISAPAGHDERLLAVALAVEQG